MTRHLFSFMVFLQVAIWVISENQASPDPQFASNFYPPAFYSYFQPASFSNQQLSPPSYHHQDLYPPNLQQFPGPYYQPFSGAYPMNENYEGEDGPYGRLFFWGLACPGPNMLLPCNCFRTRDSWWSLPVGNINCPALTVEKVKAIFSNIPRWKNIRNVTLNLPRGANVANSIPASFIRNYPQTAINIITPNDASCIDSTLLSPCTCNSGTITCPAGNSLAQIQSVFNNIAQNTNLGNVIINLPAGVNNIPANFLGRNAANSITLIGTDPGALSQLTIDSNAFAGSAATCTAITIQRFDIGVLDYTFLNGFNVLRSLNLNNCVNNPTAANPPKNLANLPLVSVLVNGVQFKKVCPSAASLTPCTCDGTGVVAVTTCPTGTTIAQMLAVFTNLPANSNLGNVVLNFPDEATTSIPAAILGNNAAVDIEVFGPIGSTSVLTIDAASFTKSASSAVQFTITSFDVANVNYSFLANFNALVNVNINTCSNSPAALNQMPNFPTNLNRFNGVIVDGNPIV